jgi:hypothetical protein
MHEAAPEPHFPRDARPRLIAHSGGILSRASFVTVLLLVARATPAQLPPSPLPLSNTEDARTLAKGTVLFRVLNAWTRIDAVYDAAADSVNHLHPLGNAFSAESLGARHFPQLGAAQGALRTLTQNPNLSLNLGQAVTTADTRVVTTPVSLAYGLTDRLTIGAMMPIVQTHSTVFIELNPLRLGANSGANVGPNAARLGLSSARSNNDALITLLAQATTALTTFVANCNSSGTCSPGTLAEATRVRDKATQFHAAAALLYGSDAQASPFSPLGTASVSQSISDQLGILQGEVNGVLGSNYAFQTPTGANAKAALRQLQQLATDPAGVALDSLGSPDRIGIGDVELSALFKLLDGFADTTAGFRLRASLRGVIRLPTGRGPSGTVAYEVGTGTGQTSADLGTLVDVRLANRLMATVAGQYTAYFTSASVSRMPNSNYALFPLDIPVAGSWREGNAVQIEATPRLQISEYFSIHGAYAFRRQAASEYTSPDVSSPPIFEATTEQRAGLGFAYSTLARYARGKSSVPLEVFFTHLETVTASGGLTPKYNRDQIEFRIYYRLRRGAR